MVHENQHCTIVAVPNANVLTKDLIGAFLILILFLLLTKSVLTPEILKLFNVALSSQSIPAWAVALGSTLLAGLLIAFPIFLITQGILYYRAARALDSTGILTKGSIAQKRVDTSGARPIYQVWYNYFLDLYALQTVDEDVFQRLTCDQSIDMLHLPHAPHISRLVLSSL